MDQIFKLRTNVCNESCEKTVISITFSKLHFASRLLTYNCSSWLCQHKQNFIL